MHPGLPMELLTETVDEMQTTTSKKRAVQTGIIKKNTRNRNARSCTARWNHERSRRTPTQHAIAASLLFVAVTLPLHWQESINDEDVYKEAQIEACWDVSFATNGPSEEDSDGGTHSDPARTAAPFIPPHVEGDTCMCNEKNLRLGLQMRNHPNY